MPGHIQDLLAQLDSVIASFEPVRNRDPTLDIPWQTTQRIMASAHAAIERAAGRKSTYLSQAELILEEKLFDGGKVEKLIGVVEALRADLAAGYLHTIEELIHGEIFADFLGMAAHLLEEGYKDAAAVIAGGALEAHLRCS